jgi:hypothetical protein
MAFFSSRSLAKGPLPVCNLTVSDFHGGAFSDQRDAACRNASAARRRPNRIAATMSRCSVEDMGRCSEERVER